MYLHYSDGTLNRQVYCAAHGHTEEVVRLLGEGADPNWQDKHGWTAVHLACINNHPRTLSVLVNSNSNINIKGEDKDTPLHIATQVSMYDNMCLCV